MRFMFGSPALLLSDLGQQRGPSPMADPRLLHQQQAHGSMIYVGASTGTAQEPARTIEVTFGSNHSVLVPLKISIPEGVTT